MKKVRTPAFAGLALALGFVVVAQGAFASAAAQHGGMKQVLATEKNGQYTFAPHTITVKAGTTVVWKNTSDAPHTVTGKGAWSSFNKSLNQGTSVSFTFKKVGTYHYFCTLHPYMVATVVVKH